MPDRIPEAILVARLLEQPSRSADLPAVWPKDIRHIAAYLDGAAPSPSRSVRHG